MIVAVNLVSSAYVYWGNRDKLDIWETRVMTSLIVAANALTISTISIEVINYFRAKEIMLATSFASPMHFSLTSLWALYFVLVILVGVYQTSKTIRLSGLLLLGIPVLKLYVYDVFLLDPVYRVIAFVTLGVLLLTTGLLYQSHGRAMKEFLFNRGS